MSEIQKFKNEIDALCKKYDITIGHEDIYGAFVLNKGYDEKAMKWFMSALIGKDNIPDHPQPK